jgi:hypothetical protein
LTIMKPQKAKRKPRAVDLVGRAGPRPDGFCRTGYERDRRRVVNGRAAAKARLRRGEAD